MFVCNIFRCLLTPLTDQDIELAMSCRSRQEALKMEEMQARKLLAIMETELAAAKASLAESTLTKTTISSTALEVTSWTTTTTSSGSSNTNSLLSSMDNNAKLVQINSTIGSIPSSTSDESIQLDNIVVNSNLKNYISNNETRVDNLLHDNSSAPISTIVKLELNNPTNPDDSFNEECLDVIQSCLNIVIASLAEESSMVDKDLNSMDVVVSETVVTESSSLNFVKHESDMSETNATCVSLSDDQHSNKEANLDVELVYVKSEVIHRYLYN